MDGECGLDSTDRNTARKGCHVDKICVPQIGTALNKKNLKKLLFTLYVIKHYSLVL